MDQNNAKLQNDLNVGDTEIRLRLLEILDEWLLLLNNEQDTTDSNSE